MKITKDPLSFDATDFYVALAVICGSWEHWGACVIFITMTLLLVLTRDKYWDDENNKPKDGDK